MLITLVAKSANKRVFNFDGLPHQVKMPMADVPPAFSRGAAVLEAVKWLNQGNIKDHWGAEPSYYDGTYIFYFKSKEDATLFALFWVNGHG